MDVGVFVPVFGGLVVIALVLFLGVRRRSAKPAAPVLSSTSEDRTFVGIAAAPRASDATMVGPAVTSAPPRSDATVVDVGPAAAPPPPPPPAAPVAAPPRPADAPTVAMSAPRPEAATVPTVRIPKLHARVTVTRGGSGTHELEAREYTVGRSASCDIVLADPSVSGHHAKLLPHGDAFAIVDLGSTNGTTVEGRAVQGEYVLRTGETIGIGDARMRYERIA